MERLLRHLYPPQTGRYRRLPPGNCHYDDEFGPDKTAEANSSSAVLMEPATNLKPSFDDTTAPGPSRKTLPADENIGDPVTATPVTTSERWFTP